MQDFFGNRDEQVFVLSVGVGTLGCMTLTDEIHNTARLVAGWDPSLVSRADAGGVCRGLVELAESVARVQVLFLVSAKATGAFVGFADVAAWLRAQGVVGRDAKPLGDATASSGTR